MIFSIPNVLTLQEVDKITKSLAQGEFINGKLNPDYQAQLVNNNQQLENPGRLTSRTTEPSYESAVLGKPPRPHFRTAVTVSQTTSEKQLTEQIKSALNRNSLFKTAVRPRAIHSVSLSRYDVDMSYDCHVDRAATGNTRIWDTDVAFTIFLNSPWKYEEGELVIESGDEEKGYKLDSGCALIYPGTSLHRVNPVKKGTRLVAVGWVQSVIRDQNDREILFDLETARRIIFTRDGKTAEFDLISKSIANLIRKWADL
ncbi:MAG: Fe2+-dependent dioxygenase [Xenococcaceae cyanobacterium MO_167.B52]|nr:Fe2+-dependent dioxygenase [Xenococcaceae cyanobacterium MO_167.B52]